MNTTQPPRRNTGRPGLEPGTNGAPWTKKRDNGRWTAAAWVRHANGTRRQVTASGASKGASLRNLQRKLDALVQPSAQGMQPNWTISQAGRHWRKRLENVGAGVTRRPLKPQTLAGYDGELTRLIEPTIGDLRLSEVTIPLLEAALQDLESQGISTLRARNVLNGIFKLAVRDGAVTNNPLPLVSLPPREPKEVEVLTIEQVHRLLVVANRDHRRAPGRRANRDLHDVVTLLVGTGMRLGECLALRNQDVDLDSTPGTLTVCGTMVEPRKKPKSMWADQSVPEWHVEKHFRQPTTKTNQVRTLVLPSAVAQQLRERRRSSPFTEPHDPLFASGTGEHLWGANIRTRLRKAVADDPTLVGTTPHTFRRTVASLIAYSLGLEAARMQLGHVIVGGALARYVAHRKEVPDYTDVLNQLFTNND